MCAAGLGSDVGHGGRDQLALDHACLELLGDRDLHRVVLLLPPRQPSTSGHIHTPVSAGHAHPCHPLSQDALEHQCITTCCRSKCVFQRLAGQGHLSQAWAHFKPCLNAPFAAAAHEPHMKHQLRVLSQQTPRGGSPVGGWVRREAEGGPWQRGGRRSARSTWRTRSQRPRPRTAAPRQRIVSGFQNTTCRMLLNNSTTHTDKRHIRHPRVPREERDLGEVDDDTSAAVHGDHRRPVGHLNLHGLPTPDGQQPLTSALRRHDALEVCVC